MLPSKLHVLVTVSTSVMSIEQVSEHFHYQSMTQAVVRGSAYRLCVFSPADQRYSGAGCLRCGFGNVRYELSFLTKAPFLRK